MNHKNGVKKDISVENLEWCTCEYNINHAWDTGLKKRLPSPMRSITMEQANEIRNLYLEGRTLEEIGKIYSLSFGSIGRIVRNERYVL